MDLVVEIDVTRIKVEEHLEEEHFVEPDDIVENETDVAYTSEKKSGNSSAQNNDVKHERSKQESSDDNKIIKIKRTKKQNEKAVPKRNEMKPESDNSSAQIISMKNVKAVTRKRTKQEAANAKNLINNVKSEKAMNSKIMKKESSNSCTKLKDDAPANRNKKKKELGKSSAEINIVKKEKVVKRKRQESDNSYAENNGINNEKVKCKNNSVTRNIKDNSDNKNKNYLIEKRYTKNGDDTFACCNCEAQFKKSSKAIRHYNAVHSQEIIKCDICNEEIKSLKTYKNHLNRKHSRRFVCPHCDKGFGQLSSFKSHFVIHLPQNQRPFPCDDCGKRFTQTASLKVHQKLHSGVKDFLCRFCGRAFRDLGNRVNHERIHSEIKPYKCDVCEKAFSDPSAFNRHKRTHTGEMKYFCKYCPKKFTDASGLIAHKVRHSKPKLSCGLCESKFYITHQLKTHVEAVHQRIKRFECHHCGKKTYSKNNLLSHINRVHNKQDFGLKTEEKHKVLVTCAICGTTTNSKFVLRRHITDLHAGELGLKEKPKTVPKNHGRVMPKFICDKCGKNYTTLNNLKHHIAAHHAVFHPCLHCSELYLSEEALQKHEQLGCSKRKTELDLPK